MDTGAIPPQSFAHTISGHLILYDKSNTLLHGADIIQFIKYKPNPNAQDEIAGTVDMQGYLQWLNNHGYNVNLTIQGEQ